MSWDLAINIGLASSALLFLLFSKFLDEEHTPLKLLFFCTALFLTIHLIGFNLSTYEIYGATYNSTINASTGLWFASSVDKRIDTQLSSVYTMATYIMYLAMLYLVFYLLFKFFKKGESNLDND